MDVLNAILNTVALLLWSLWLLRRGGEGKSANASGWLWLGAVAVLLILRAVFYWEIGSPLGWVFHWSLGVVSIPFTSDSCGRMMLYSALSFLKALVMFHTLLAAVSSFGRPLPAGNNVGDAFRRVAGRAASWPGWLLWLLSSLVAALAWPPIAKLLQHEGLTPSVPFRDLLLQAALIGGAMTHLWLWTLAVMAGLALLHRHFYLGGHPLWVWLAAASTNSLRWVNWIPARVGNLDLRPLVGLIMAVALSIALNRMLVWR